MYIPVMDWPELSTICAEVHAADLWDPVHEMEPFEFCFSTPAEPIDTYPPYFVDLSITPGDTAVYTFQTIRIKIRDSERGVDRTSIGVVVDGVEYTNFTVTPIAGFLYDYSVSILPPVGGWLPRNWYEVSVTGCDRADIPNCNDTTFTFRTAGLTPPSLEFAFSIFTTNGDADTVRNTLTFATDPIGTPDFDAGLDIASPSPDFASFGYFPISDPAHPYVSRLQKDVQPNDDLVQWTVEYNNPRSLCE
jgi:hypothetical protein